jgi:hypothetical protein
MTRAKAVENLTTIFFSARHANNLCRFRFWTAPSRVASLDPDAVADKIIAALNLLQNNTLT